MLGFSLISFLINSKVEIFSFFIIKRNRLLSLQKKNSTGKAKKLSQRTNGRKVAGKTIE
jgi:hypothetical protein